MATTLEHVNVTVTDPERTAAMLVDVFGWTIRWKGESLLGGRTIHVGGPENGDDYLAIYTTDSEPEPMAPRGSLGNLNHIALLVDDLDAIEAKILAAGYETHTHGDYEPGRRYYFHDHDGIEYEIVSYN